MTPLPPDTSTLNSIFDDCRQCGACCKRYRRILLQPEEVPFIERMGGHVGVDVSLDALREQTMAELVDKARKEGRIYMVHPDENGCVFLQKRNDTYSCKIYHYRPKTCRGFHCNLADQSFLNVISDDAILLLGQNQFGLSLE
jgi:Fe-S-cluster containining protein